MTVRLSINPKTVTSGAFIELLDEDDTPVAIIPVLAEFTAPHVSQVRDYVAIEWAEDICFAVNQYVQASDWENSTRRPYSGFHREPGASVCSEECRDKDHIVGLPKCNLRVDGREYTVELDGEAFSVHHRHDGVCENIAWGTYDEAGHLESEADLGSELWNAVELALVDLVGPEKVESVLYATDVLERLKQGTEALVGEECAARVEQLFMGSNPVHVDAVQAMLTQFDLKMALLMVMDRATVPETSQEALYHYVNKTEQFMFGNDLGERTVVEHFGDYELVTYETGDEHRIENLRAQKYSEWLHEDEIANCKENISCMQTEVNLCYDFDEEGNDE